MSNIAGTVNSSYSGAVNVAFYGSPAGSTSYNGGKGTQGLVGYGPVKPPKGTRRPPNKTKGKGQGEKTSAEEQKQ